MKKVNISVINDLVTDQRLARMAGTLHSMGFEVHAVGRELRGSFPFESEVFSGRRMKLLFSKGPLFYASFNFRLFFHLLFRAKPDFYVAIDLDTLLANYLLSRIRSVPLMYDSHEYFTEVPELVDRKRVKKIWEYIEARIVPKLKYAIAVSGSISKVYKEKYGIDFVTIRNLSEAVSYEVRDVKEKYVAPYTIIYQGALNKGRGLELVIQAMKWMEDSRLLIVGDGDVSVDLKALAREERVDDKVEFLGKVKPVELKRLTYGCHVGISLEEDLGLNYRMALPNKIFDYVQARIPVLCSDLPEMSALVREYGIGEVVVSRDPRALAAQMSKMLANEVMMEVWMKNLDSAAGELVWEKEEEKLKEVVQGLMA